MENLKNKPVGIIGAGTMGSGIAQVASTAGHKVFLYDIDVSSLDSSREKLVKILERLVDKEKIDQSKADSITKNINYTTFLEDIADCRIVIEAAVEDLEIKQRIFHNVESAVSEEAIISTNTSSLSVTSIAAAVENPGRVIGTHFFNPAPLMALVEVVPAVQTNKEIIEPVVKLMESWGKAPAVAKDTPGFIVNRVARPFYGEALRILEEGIASIEQIDYAMKKTGGFRMGPFELMDLIGNDVNYAVTETVFREFYFDPRYKPSFTQKRLVEAEMFGRKTGKGFYNYEGDILNAEPEIDENLAIEIFMRIVSMLINEAADAVYWNIASVEDIDKAMTKGVNYPKGLLKWCDEIGAAKILRRIEMLREETSEERYRPSPLLKKMAKEGKKFYPNN